MIEILPESSENLLAVKATEKLTAKDYEEIFIPKLNELIRQYGKIRVLFCLADSFKGWEFGAMWDDAKFGIKHRNDFEKIAVAGGPNWVQWATKIAAHFIKCDVKTFKTEELQEALNWIGN